MRIALLCWESLHSVAVGGMAVHVTELAAALERRGHEMHVFTRRGYGQSDYDRIHGVHYHRCDHSPSCDFVDESRICASPSRPALDVWREIASPSRSSTHMTGSLPAV